ncbi:hypothetical protein [Sphingobium lignivorans]|uniref:ABC-2 type transport system permease protein n=1 Tax=Sphingobium lignivorans TaxID=2735886 RepID=A0ABR6NBT0_9SPHN|nr:hypothetical protein [Sphingobium lignivorans]MBB5984737.1 hypothetical protein [Sphingobium lignivorans]
MSAAGVVRSAARAGLLRYRRSWGLWLLLLVAPVGARFMIGDESGGVHIAIDNRLPLLTAPVLGLWLGIVVSTLLLPVAYAYLRANVTRRQPWQVEEVTAASRIAIMLGRFVADAAVLLAALTALTLAGWFLCWLLAQGPLDLPGMSYGLWIIAAPSLIGLAALRCWLSARPWLRGGAGDLLFVLLWLTSIAMPAMMQGSASSFSSNLLDFAGYYRPLVAGAPGGASDFAIGGVEVEPGRVVLDVAKALGAPGYAASRMAWIGIAILLVILSGLAYRPHRAGRRAPMQGRLARLLSAGPPPPADPAASPALPARRPFAGLLWSELRLIGTGRVFLLLASAAAAIGLAGDYRRGGSVAALLLLAFALSAHAGRCEARGLLMLTRTTCVTPAARRAAFLAAGTLWALLMALPAALVRLSPDPLLLALGTGAAASAGALGLAMLSGGPFAPRLVLLVAWYAYFSA